MNITGFFTSLITWYITAPTAVLCFAPMKNQMRSSRRKDIFLALATLTVPSLIIAVLKACFTIPRNALMPIMIIPAFIVYLKCVRGPVYKALSVFVLVSAFMSFLMNVSNGFDALLHPYGTLNNYSLEAAVFLALISTVFALATFHPATKASVIIDRFDIPRVYYASLPVWGIFVAFNLLISPRKYETLHVNKMQLAFWGSLGLFFLLLCLLCVWFYYIVSDMMKKTEAEARNRILEMQESTYLSQQRYMKESAKIRHDFKHTIGTLDALVSAGDLSSVRAYLDDYLAMQPTNDTVSFCENTAVNALLNYYMNMAKTSSIPLEWEIDMPAELHVSDIDLCGILGNILENAIHACEKLPEADRFIDLILRYEAGVSLYIIVTNSFDGNVRMNGTEYLSTGRHGSGLGLISIRETAEKYNGLARFSHDEKEFHTDVMLKAKN